MNIYRIILICIASFIVIGCEFNITDTQHIDIDYYADNEKNIRLAEDLIYYDPRYIASNVPLLNEKTAPGIQLGYFIRSSDKKPSYKITYSLKNPDIASNIEELKNQFNQFIPELAAFHASKESLFNEIKLAGNIWASKLFTNEASTLLSNSSSLLKESVSPEQFMKMTTELTKTYGRPLSIDFVRAQYYKKFSSVPESVSIYYKAIFSNQNKLIIRISMHEQDKKWVVMGFQFQKTNA